ncbi:MAG: SGNH/GDSL hydrolase family protein [Clostridia bacterium]|nr:SGNH/GDSL hydrolase family protein [Clostridia bacterium]
MDFFKTYSSNTFAGTLNQCFFISDGTARTGRVFYRISSGGTYNYSLLYSNTVDSTYPPVEGSYRNMPCEDWQINLMRLAVCTKEAFDKFERDGFMPEMDFKEVTFAGETVKSVSSGEVFSTDPIEMTFEKNDYLCVEISFTGTKIPNMCDLNIPGFSYENGKWIESNRLPVPDMIGCDRKVALKIGYFGDSITQGIGTDKNSYEHWNAKLSERLGEENSYWNMGIAAASGNDAASFGAWFDKAIQNDLVVMCFGVNDIMGGGSCEQLTSDIASVVERFYENGCKVILQTVPPFVYNKPMADIWRKVNEYIKNVLSQKVEAVFDNVPYLQDEGENSHMDKYGDHPNAGGCSVWAEAIYPCVKGVAEKMKKKL